MNAPFKPGKFRIALHAIIPVRALLAVTNASETKFLLLSKGIKTLWALAQATNF